MLATIGLSIVYFKIISFSSYGVFAVINYNYDMTKLLNHKIITGNMDYCKNKFPTIADGLVVAHDFTHRFVSVSSTVVINALNQGFEQWGTNYKINLCPQRLSTSLINSSIMCKICIPLFAVSSIYYANRTINKMQNKK